MSLKNIVAGDYGQTIQLAVLDMDTEAAADLSAYTESQELVFQDPAGTETTVTAAFATDGSDGVVEYTLEDGDIDTAGFWQVRVQVTSATAKLRSTWHRFEVIE